MTASTTRHRNSMSLRVASSAENCTSSVLPGPLDRIDGGLEAGFLRHPQLALEMQVGGGDEGVDAAARRRRQRPTRAVDVGRMTARERGNDGTPDVGRDETHRLGVGLRGDRKPGSMMSTPSVDS